MVRIYNDIGIPGMFCPKTRPHLPEITYANQNLMVFRQFAVDFGLWHLAQELFLVGQEEIMGEAQMWV